MSPPPPTASILALPSICAAMPSSAPMVSYAEAADAADGDAVGTIQCRTRGRLGQFANIADPGRRTFAQLTAVDRDEGRTKAFDTGIVLVAGRLVDGALAPEFGLQRLHRNAVRLHRAIATAFADRGIDEHTARRTFCMVPRLRRRRFSAAQVCTNTMADAPLTSRSFFWTASSSSRWAVLVPGAMSEAGYASGFSETR